MNILVTGAKGQLGNSLKMAAVNLPDLNIAYTDIDELDILNKVHVQDFIKTHKPELLINCAAYTAVDKAEEYIQEAKLVNSVAPGILAESMNQNGGRMIHISTDYVFDGAKESEYTETDTVNPVSVYGVTKAEGELKVLQYPENLVIRTAWLYSEFGHNFFKTMIRLFTEKDEVRIVNDQFGSPTYATDFASAILEIAKKLNLINSCGGIYHYSNMGETSWYHFALEINNLAGLECSILPISTEKYPTAANRPKYSLLSKEKIINTFDLKIPDWKDSLKKCFLSYKKN